MKTWLYSLDLYQSTLCIKEIWFTESRVFSFLLPSPSLEECTHLSVLCFVNFSGASGFGSVFSGRTLLLLSLPRAGPMPHRHCPFSLLSPLPAISLPSWASLWNSSNPLSFQLVCGEKLLGPSALSIPLVPTSHPHALLCKVSGPIGGQTPCWQGAWERRFYSLL